MGEHKDVVHVTSGDRGKTGDPGEKGDKGEKGAPYSSFITRNAIAAYLFLAIGIIAIAFYSYTINERVVNEVRRITYSNCEAGNKRSMLALGDYIATKDRVVQFATGLNLPPEEVDRIRRDSLGTLTEQIEELPFLNCNTGEPVPPPVYP